MNSPDSGGVVIAVLPFRNLGGNAEEDFFAQGLVGELINALARFDSLRVVAQQSTARYQGNQIDVRKAGRELGARFVLEGNIRRLAKQIRVTASLIDVDDGARLWGDTYDRDLTTTDLFTLEDDLTRAVVAHVGNAWGVIPRVLVEASRDTPPRELASHEAGLRFLVYLSHFRAEDFSPAMEALEAAVEREPGYGPSRAMLAILVADDYLRGLTAVKGPPERAWELANRATSLAPGSALAHLSRSVAAFVSRRPEIVIEEAERAISLNPNNVVVVSFAGFLIGFAGEYDRGIAILREMEKLNPHFPSWLLALACLRHYMEGEYGEALALGEKFDLDLWPGKPLYLAATFGQLGRKREAAEQLRLLKEIEPDFTADPEDYITRNFLFGDQVEKILEGLAKAGL